LYLKAFVFNKHFSNSLSGCLVLGLDMTHLVLNLTNLVQYVLVWTIRLVLSLRFYLWIMFLCLMIGRWALYACLLIISSLINLILTIFQKDYHFFSSQYKHAMIPYQSKNVYFFFWSKEVYLFLSVQKCIYSYRFKNIYFHQSKNINHIQDISIIIMTMIMIVIIIITKIISTINIHYNKITW